uniref:Uncharacterized protein n=1 Tax=Knipowitschia caucasica TaxID=637954 RepID=A0AAV2LXL6_KNICA
METRGWTAPAPLQLWNRSQQHHSGYTGVLQPLTRPGKSEAPESLLAQSSFYSHISKRPCAKTLLGEGAASWRSELRTLGSHHFLSLCLHPPPTAEICPKHYVQTEMSPSPILLFGVKSNVTVSQQDVTGTETKRCNSTPELFLQVGVWGDEGEVRGRRGTGL